MANFHPVQPGRTWIGRLAHGEDLLESIAALAREQGVRLARVEALGAVQTARLGFYDQRSKEYHFFRLKRRLEIASLVGNVSLKDGEPMVHAHVTLTDADGAAFGGHLGTGTIVFSCEVCLQELSGTVLERGLDETTGLPLWTS